MADAESVAESRALRVGGAWIAGTGVVLAGLWLLDVFVLATDMLATVQSRPALTPLYAIWMPAARPTAWVFALVAVAATVLMPRCADPDRTSSRAFAAALVVAAAVLAWALFLVRDPTGACGAQFEYYAHEEFWQDARTITDLRGFVAHHVELAPQLSTHGRHFPPGHTVLLHLLQRAFGTHTLVAGIAVLALAAASLPFVWLALRELTGERAARQGAALVASAPAFLDFACTAMDAVFLFFAAAALWLGLRAFGERGRARDAVLAGVALCAASFVSFSAFPLGLALFAYALIRRRAAAWKPLLICGASYAGAALLLDLATGYAIWDGLQGAWKQADAFMAGVRARHERVGRARLSYGNIVAFAIGAGVPLIAVCAARIRRDGLRGRAWSLAALGTLAVLAIAPLHHLETERIWLYALPWVAGVAVSGGPLDDASLRRVVGVALAQAFALEIALFTLW